MESRSITDTREVAVPAGAFSTLREELVKQAGRHTAVHALHAAGYGTGADLQQALVRHLGDDASGLPVSTLWHRFSGFLSRRGWGSLEATTPHAGVGLLTSDDWAEVGGAPDNESRPSCSFSCGLLSYLLTRVAGEPVAVVEVSCRTAGDPTCRFAFGSESTVAELYDLLRVGHDLDAALSEL